MSTPTIGVIHLPELAAHLREAGIAVIAEDDFRATAKAIAAHDGQVVLVAADHAGPGQSPWLGKALRTYPAVLLSVDSLEGQPVAPVREHGQATAMAAPVPVAELLGALGDFGYTAQGVLQGDGTVHAPQVAPPPVNTWPQQTQPPEQTPATPAHSPTWPTQPAPAQPTTQAAPKPWPAKPATASVWGAPASQVAPQPAHGQVPPARPAAAPAQPTWEQVQAPPAPSPPQPATPHWPQPPEGQAPHSLTAHSAPPEPAPQPDWAPVQQPLAPARPQAPALDSVHDSSPAPVPAVTPVTAIPHTTPYDTQGSALPAPQHHRTSPRTSSVPVIFSIAGKGGVGKTTTAMLLAQRAARIGGLKVALIDGNRGQGDTRIFLRLSRSGLPTIYDVATGTDPADVIITPGRLAAARPADVDPLHFALVMAPPPSLADPGVVTARIYADVLAAARAMADLVIVDTQITEGADTSGLFDQVWIPAMATHAWAVGISDLSSPGVENLITRLQSMVDGGVPVTRVGLFLNKVPAELIGSAKEQNLKKAMSPYGYYLGRVLSDHEVIGSTNLGELPYAQAELAGVLDQVLFRATSMPEFTEQHHQQDTSSNTPRKGLRGLLRRGGK